MAAAAAAAVMVVGPGESLKVVGWHHRVGYSGSVAVVVVVAAAAGIAVGRWGRDREQMLKHYRHANSRTVVEVDLNPWMHLKAGQGLDWESELQ